VETQLDADNTTLELLRKEIQCCIAHTPPALEEEFAETFATLIAQWVALDALLPTDIQFSDLLLWKDKELLDATIFAQLFTQLEILEMTFLETLWHAEFTTPKSPFLPEI